MFNNPAPTLRWLFVFALLATTAGAEFRLPALFSDHVVLQANTAVPVWGWADSQTEITVRFAGQEQTTIATAEGRWRLTLAPITASAEPREMEVSAKNHQSLIINHKLSDVLVGEVWLAAGQSNMQLRVNEAAGGAEAAASAALPAIRMFTVAQRPAVAPAEDCEGQWVVCSPESVGRFSAAAFYFARELQAAGHGPVGVIHASWGATPIETWTSADALARRPELGPALAAWKDPAEPLREDVVSRRQWKNHPAYLYNGMIAPLIPYALRGAIWYQGENNANSTYADLYARQLPLLIEDWRQRWGRPLPFAWVQLPNFQPKPVDPARLPRWPIVREAMRRSLVVPNTGMAVTIDIGEADNIHPRDKLTVGQRLARWARARVYGEPVAYASPEPTGFKFGEGCATITFAHTDGGLVARDGELRGFFVAGADQQWVAAHAEIHGDTVVVSSAAVPSPVAVRYAWADNPACNLFNGAGLPAMPFRSDDWAR